MFTVEKQGAVTVLHPQAAITAAHCADLVAAATSGMGGGRPMLVVDLHGVPLVDSAGLEALIELRERIEARGGAMKLAGVNALCGDILRVTGVGQKFEQHAHVKTAVGSFAE